MHQSYQCPCNAIMTPTLRTINTRLYTMPNIYILLIMEIISEFGVSHQCTWRDWRCPPQGLYTGLHTILLLWHRLWGLNTRFYTMPKHLCFTYHSSHFRVWCIAPIHMMSLRCPPRRLYTGLHTFLLLWHPLWGQNTRFYTMPKHLCLLIIQILSEFGVSHQCTWWLAMPTSKTVHWTTYIPSYYYDIHFED